MGRSQMTEAEKEVERAKAKQRAYLKTRGRGGYVDAAEMQARIRKLHDVHQITFERIAERTGVDLSNIRSHYYGKAITRANEELSVCFWRTHNAVMTTKFGPADVRKNVRACGTKRRLQALIAAGYSQAWLAEATGRTLTHLNHFLVKDGDEVGAAFAGSVEQVYLKYSETDPLEAGVPSRSVAYSKTVARKRGYFPVSCWDWDTIDDPDAIPEWTGVCGTEEGYRIHVRETIFNDNSLPPCDACRAVVETQSATRSDIVIFKHEEFARQIEKSDIPIKKLARMIGVNADTVYRWRHGDRSPRRRSQVDDLAVALGCDADDLLDIEAIKREESRPVIGQGEFNPYVFVAALEYANMSRKAAAEIIGVDDGSVRQWVERRCKPNSKDRITPLAEHFGVSVEVFYT